MIIQFILKNSTSLLCIKVCQCVNSRTLCLSVKLLINTTKFIFSLRVQKTKEEQLLNPQQKQTLKLKEKNLNTAPQVFKFKKKIKKKIQRRLFVLFFCEWDVALLFTKQLMRLRNEYGSILQCVNYRLLFLNKNISL